MEVRVVATVAIFDESGRKVHTATYTYAAPERASADTIHGAVIVARFGTLAVSLRIEAFRPVPVAMVADLMANKQATCLQSSARCPQLDMPASMMSAIRRPATSPASS